MPQQLQSIADHFSLAWRGLRRTSKPGLSKAENSACIDELNVDTLPADIEDLLDSTAELTVQFSSAWYRNFAHQVAPQGYIAKFFVLRREGAAIVALPVFLHRSDHGHIRHVDALANYYTALFAPALSPTAGAGDLAILLLEILKKYPRVASMRFSPLSPDHPSFQIMKDALASCGLLTFPFFAFGNWYRDVADVSWAALRVTLNSRLKSTLSRRSKKFAADRGRLEVVTDSLGLEEALNGYQAVYAKSWKKPEPFAGFMPGLIRTCAEKGWLRLGVAWLGEEPIAAQVWIVADGRAEIFKLAYDERYAQYSAGTLLTACLFEYTLDRDKVREVDYLIGDDTYKKEWVDNRRERWGLIAYNPNTFAGLFGACKESTGRILKLMKLRSA